MTITAAGQVWIFFGTIMCGIALGMLFDVFRILRQLRKPTVLEANIQDIVFWTTSAIIVFAVIFVINNGELRFFEFIGIFAAGMLYNMTLSKYIVKLGVLLFTGVRKVLLFIVRIVLFPVVWVCKLFKKPFFIVINAGKTRLRCVKRHKNTLIRRMQASVKNFFKIFKKV